ncbi:MAG: YicC/YloC family endoribonuclease [Gammaproteobacteria bacterium]
MTAFARREASTETGAMVCELRTVNHRYFEFFARLPDELRATEGQLREKAQRLLSRGKLDCQLRYHPVRGAASQLSVNTELAKEVIRVCEDLQKELREPASISAIDILGWPGVTVEPEQDYGRLHASALKLFGEALDELIDTRKREGARLQELIEQRTASMRELVVKVRERRPDVHAAIREKLLARLEDLQARPDNDRLEQELVYLAQKMDVDEELDRLETHLKELDEVFGRKEAIGRRIDFLLQELNREANTLASKAADIETTQAAVELKVLIEQVREQVQNIE